MKKRIISAAVFVLVMVMVVCTGCNSDVGEKASEKDITTSADAVADVTSPAENETSTDKDVTESKKAEVNEHLTVALTTEATDSTKKPSTGKLTAEEAVDIYLKNQQTWMPDIEYFTMGGYRYIFLDLDFDGILELVVNVNDGSGRYSTNTYFRINKNTKKVESIKTDESDKFEVGFDYGNTIKLVKNSATGKMKYYCIDFLRVSSQEYGSYYGVMYFENNTINTEYLFSEAFFAAGTYENTEDTEKFYYHIGDKSVETTKDDYENRVNDFFVQNKDSNLKYKEVDGSEYEDAGQSQRKAMLLKSYNAFSYNK